MLTEFKVVAECERNLQERYKLYYRLSSGQTVLEDSLYPSFSVYVSVNGLGSDYFDEATVNDISSREDVAFKFFEFISDGLVTPSTLHDVAEDFVADL